MVAFYSREQYEALCFHVEELDALDRVESLLAISMNALMAIAAFDIAVDSRPHRHIRLRHRARVLRELRRMLHAVSFRCQWRRQFHADACLTGRGMA